MGFFKNIIADSRLPVGEVTTMSAPAVDAPVARYGAGGWPDLPLPVADEPVAPRAVAVSKHRQGIDPEMVSSRNPSPAGMPVSDETGGTVVAQAAGTPDGTGKTAMEQPVGVTVSRPVSASEAVPVPDGSRPVSAEAVDPLPRPNISAAAPDRHRADIGPGGPAGALPDSSCPPALPPDHVEAVILPEDAPAEPVAEPPVAANMVAPPASVPAPTSKERVSPVNPEDGEADRIEAAPEPLPATPRQPAAESPLRRQRAARPPQPGPASATPAPRAPQVRIGQVNVIVEGPAEPRPQSKPAGTKDLSSRLFLRSL